MAVCPNSSERGSKLAPYPDHIKGPAINGLSAIKATTLAHLLQHMRFGTTFLRAVNYHATPASSAAQLENQLAYFAENYTSVAEKGLDQVLSGEWCNRRPAIIISFDDGLLSNFTVAARLLRKHGLTGWFFLPALLTELCSREAPRDERGLALAHHIRVSEEEQGVDEVFMRWEHARELANEHVVGCHSMTHVRLGAALGEHRLRWEIVDSKSLMEDKLQRDVESFCWVGGEHWSYSAQAATLIRIAGYRYAFMNSSCAVTVRTSSFQLGRTRLEPSWPISWVDFYMSGILDIARIGTRKRAEKTTKQPQAREAV